jgi:hypothetical protein
MLLTVEMASGTNLVVGELDWFKLENEDYGRTELEPAENSLFVYSPLNIEYIELPDLVVEPKKGLYCTLWIGFRGGFL